MKSKEFKNMYNLMPNETLNRTPKLYKTDNIPNTEKEVQAVYYQLFGSNWTYYLVEYDKEKDLAFGLVAGLDVEWGYFNLKKLEELNFTRDLTKEYPQTFRELEHTELRKQLEEWELNIAFNDDFSKTRYEVMKNAIDKYDGDIEHIQEKLCIKNNEKELLEYINQVHEIKEYDKETIIDSITIY